MLKNFSTISIFPQNKQIIISDKMNKFIDKIIFELQNAVNKSTEECFPTFKFI